MTPIITYNHNSVDISVTEPPAIPPKFTIQLRPQAATDGEEVVLSCKVTGCPMPDLSWLHNDKCIDTSEDFVINYNRQTGQCDCVIVECLPDDHGVFKCVARNPGGQAITTGMLAVKPKAGIQIDEGPVLSKVSQRVRTAPPQRPPSVNVNDTQVKVSKRPAILIVNTKHNFPMLLFPPYVVLFPDGG